MENPKRNYIHPSAEFFSEYDTETELMYGGIGGGGKASGLVTGSRHTQAVVSDDDDDEDDSGRAREGWSDFEYYVDLGV